MVTELGPPRPYECDNCGCQDFTYPNYLHPCAWRGCNDRLCCPCWLSHIVQHTLEDPTQKDLVYAYYIRTLPHVEEVCLKLKAQKPS